MFLLWKPFITSLCIKYEYVGKLKCVVRYLVTWEFLQLKRDRVPSANSFEQNSAANNAKSITTHMNRGQMGIGIGTMWERKKRNHAQMWASFSNFNFKLIMNMFTFSNLFPVTWPWLQRIFISLLFRMVFRSRCEYNYEKLLAVIIIMKWNEMKRRNRNKKRWIAKWTGWEFKYIHIHGHIEWNAKPRNYICILLFLFRLEISIAQSIWMINSPYYYQFY